MATKVKKDSIVSQVIKGSKAKDTHRSIIEVDQIVNHHLELNDNKEGVVRQIIKDINKSAKQIKNKNFFNSVNAYFKGKLFYIAYKEAHKYLIISDIEKIVDRRSLIGFINEIEMGQDYGWDLIDNIKNPILKDFLYGIFTYIYF